ncbi:MAG: radical SAM protein [Promethearchaeota archaeon]
MQIKGVDFLVTFKCPAKCSHCSYKAAPDRKGQMELEDVERYFKELADTQPLQSITVHGGEPFLCFDLLKSIMKKAKELGIPHRGVITNSYWAKTQIQAKKKLTELKEAGLTHITFSVDGFHQEFIPVEYVRNAIIVAANIGFEKLWVDSYFVGDLNSDNHPNYLTRKAIAKLGELDKVEMNRYSAGFEGRGADLAKYVESKGEIPTGRCPLPFWIGGSLKAPTTVEIDFEGNVTLCPGICIGNAKNYSLTEIILSYNCSTHPILSKIEEQGPIGLLEAAKAKGFKQQQSFVNECHLCYELRKFLRPYYPQYLAPAGCY